MPVFYKNNYFLFVKLIFFVFFIMAVFSCPRGHFIFVKAFDSQVKIVPGAYSEDDSANSGFADFKWKNFDKAFNHELPQSAGFLEFNENNSAYIKAGSAGAPSIQGSLRDNGADEAGQEPGEILEIEPTGSGSKESPGKSPETDKSEDAGALENEREGAADSDNAGQDSQNGPAATEPEPIGEKQGISARSGSFSFRLPVKQVLKVLADLFSNSRFFSMKSVQARDQTAPSEDNTSKIENNNFIKQSVIFSDFSVPLPYQGSQTGKIALRLSLAARSEFIGDNILVEFDAGFGWEQLGAISINSEISNSINSDYFKFALPDGFDWGNIDNLKIKISYDNKRITADNKDSQLEVYLDALWLEAEYDAGAQEDDEIEIDELGEVLGEQEAGEDLPEGKEINIKFVAGRDSFQAGEIPALGFEYRRDKNFIGRLLSGLYNLVFDEYKDIGISARLYYGREFKPVGLEPKIKYEKDGRFKIDFASRARSFAPGRYRLLVIVNDNGAYRYLNQDFSWGVLALNTNKSIYLPGERAFIQMAVLDDEGHTVCDANLELEIISPAGVISRLNTDDGSVTSNPACGLNNVIDSPDYYAYWDVADSGFYQIKLKAVTANGEREIIDGFEVKNSVPFEVERIGPTRIYPLAAYLMKFKIKANQDYKGEFIEYVPNSFALTSGNPARHRHDFGDQARELVWDVEFRAGGIYEIEYEFDAPDVSPEFYLLGPARIGGFIEIRNWQIASDAVFVFNGNAGNSVNWTNPGRAWDLTNNTYAQRQIPGSSGSDQDAANYIEATANNSTSQPADIIMVEIGIEAYVNDTRVNGRIRPRFNGTTNGALQTIPGAVMGTSDSQNTFYVNITSDPAGPGAGNWTWSDIANLDIRVHGANTFTGNRIFYIDQFRIKVTTANMKPTGEFNYISQRADASGIVDFSIEANDPEGSTTTKAKIEYISGSDCNFTSPQDPVLDEATSTITADFGAPRIDNNQPYQVGTSTGWITTAFGSNTVNFQWPTKNQSGLEEADGVYCARLTVNDGQDDQNVSATSTFIIDNKAPTAPGQMSTGASGTRAILTFGDPSVETNFAEYKIFYKQGSSDVTEEDSVHSSSSDPNLSYKNYNNREKTIIYDLLPNTQYVFNIWAYDKSGNKASSTEVTVTTGSAEKWRANTVIFPAGAYSGNGTTGQNSNADQTLSSFDFKLAEKEVIIKKAFVVLDIRYESYSTGGIYNGYDLAFDACAAPCSPSAFSGDGKVVKNDATTLSYGEASSYEVRLFLDVTNEIDIFSYAGASGGMKGQVGYNLKRNTAANSISMSRAHLFISYVYDEDIAVDFTNTVVYPLESYAAGDSGTRRAAQGDDCVKDSNCPLFSYHMAIPEVSQRITQWFETYNVNDAHTSNNFNVNVNIEGTNEDSATFVLQATNGGEQGNTPAMTFSSVAGFSENITQYLEYYAACPTSGATYYLIGGESFNTYIASSSAQVKTRTVSFPIGAINNGLTISKTDASVNVYFPENGPGSGTVTIKKAWVRIVSNNYNTGANTYTVSTRVGNNAESTSFVYNYDAGGTVVRPSFTVVHVIPSGDYAELESANASIPKAVTVYTTNSSAAQGGSSAELMITYAYTGELNGYLSSISLMAGQGDGVATNNTINSAVQAVLPEVGGVKTIRAGSLLAAYSISDPDNNVLAANLTLDANISTTTPVCVNAYNSRPDDVNSFTEFYKNATSSLLNVNNQLYNICYSVAQATNANCGAKAGGILRYTYSWDAPPPVLTQKDWRWYENANSVNPGVARAAENATTTNVNLADVLRLRVNIGASNAKLATTSQAFKLQYATSSDCTSASSWTDVGGIGGNGAWTGYDNSQASDGATSSQPLLSSSTKFQSYEEINPSVLNPGILLIGEYGEWDWVIYNSAAAASTSYCFRMAKSDGEAINYEESGQAKLVTAPVNTQPNNPENLRQYRNSVFSQITGSSWINENSVRLNAAATDVNINEALNLYFELIASSSSFTEDTSRPTNACESGTTWAACDLKIWKTASSSVGDYRMSPFISTTTITAIPDLAEGYKWQVLACDDDDACSNWTKFYPIPGFKIDITPPSSPGPLAWTYSTSTAITLAFTGSTDEINFREYRIFYKPGSLGVSESDLEHIDPALKDKFYLGNSTTTITNLSAGTPYVFNIWAYDWAGNKASATPELATSTTSSFTKPTGSIYQLQQEADGSGSIRIVIKVKDDDNDDTLRAKIMYEASNQCVFSPPLDPTIDPDPARISDSFPSFPDPVVDNNYPYQVGTTSGWIITSPGENYVSFYWLSKIEEPDAYGTYSIGLVVNDGIFDQLATSCSQVFIDNVAPQPAGPLTLNKKNYQSLTLNFGAPGFDNRFDRYRIFYSTSSPVTENDFQHFDNDRLLTYNYGGYSTTTISGLTAGTVYYVNIWAYDLAGNRASSTIFATSTNSLPYNLTIGGQFKDDETTAIDNGGWTDENTIKLNARVLDNDPDEMPALYFQFITATGTFLTATTVPANACVYGEAYDVCTSKVWFSAPAQTGDYSFSPYVGTTSIIAIPNSAAGYKWQVLACDDDNDCANSWVKFDLALPNVRVDTIEPTPPGQLSENSKTSNQIILNFGASTTETNFKEYKIYYSTSSPVTESDYLHSSSADPSLGYINYNNKATTTIRGFLPNTTYYLNIWAYDWAGNKASSTEIAITTNPAFSTPGVLFYSKNTRDIFYRIWTGSVWLSEQTGPTLGVAGDNILQIASLRSNDGGKIALLIKTLNWPNTQKWWGVVYRVAANSFDVPIQLGATYGNSANSNLITGCIGSLSGGGFFIIRNNNGANGTIVFSWDAVSGWTEEGAGPNPGAILNGCRLVNRPGTDNYLLLTFDDDLDVGTSYYYGGASYDNTAWTAWTEHSTNENNADNYVGEAFFNPNNNGQGAINYSNSATNGYTIARKFTCDSTSITFTGSATTTPQDSPDNWSGAFVHGEFATDPNSSASAFYAGRDTNDELNVYWLDIAGANPGWSTVTNGDNISGGNLYDETNYSQKPFAIMFPAEGKGVVVLNENTSATPKYRVIDTSAKSVSASNLSVPGAEANIWMRVRFYEDPFENELLAVYQNDDTDYSAVFWDGANSRFYNSTDNPGSNQVWTELATAAVASNGQYERATFAFAAPNMPPNSLTNLNQYRSTGTTTIPNGGWINENTVRLTAAATDPDTSEIIRIYLNLIAGNDSFATSTVEPPNPCASTTPFGDCNSKIWLVASSTTGDYSNSPFRATATIPSLQDSTIGYKWQMLACDDEDRCSSWAKFNVNTPNFYVDTVPPSPPGPLTVAAKTSNTVTLNFGSTTDENILSFKEYKIFYKIGSDEVSESDMEHIDLDLTHKNYNSTTNTVVSGLASSTQYVFNIWAYDKAGNSASSTYVSTTTSSGPYLRQMSFLLENDDGANVNSNTSEVGASTTLAGVHKGERINIRIQIENSGDDSAASKIYRLQFNNLTDTPTVWSDVGAATAISYSLGLSGTNNDTISSSTAAANSNIWANGSWHEGANQTAAYTLNFGRYTEFVFAVQTASAIPDKTYRLRLVSVTDSWELNYYNNYPVFTIEYPETKRFSKSAVASLPANNSDLAYYFDPRGYMNIAADDGSRDPLTSMANIPVFLFAIKHATNTDALWPVWKGQSTTNTAYSQAVMQAYRFGTGWVTMAQNSTTSTSTDFSLAAGINSNLSQFYDGNNWTYWRIYQSQGSHTMSSDYFYINYASATPVVSQIHYRWRNDDGGETTATWREPEDTGDPTGETEAININENIRLRLAAVNLGGGMASGYNYKIEYATSTGSCVAGIGEWTSVGTSDEPHWRISTSTYFADNDLTTATTTNAEGYNFVSGRMVEDPSVMTSGIGLPELGYTEIEYVLRATENAEEAGTYCFRTTNNGASLNNYEEYPILTLAGSYNAAPYFTTWPSDNNSASSTPTNLGSAVQFTATAQDDDGDDYHLIVCKTNSVTAGNDNNPPVCNGGEWCISPLASSTQGASCEYIASTTSEILHWWAFVCDRHSGFAIAKCSAASQGGGDANDDSPFIVNHPPVFSSVITSENNKDPGGTFKISTVSYDSDTEVSTNTLYLFVCRTNSADFDNGCTGGPANTVCQAIATSSPNAECTYTDTAPTPAGSNTYYAFIFDSWRVPAVANSLSNTYTINNVAPVLGGLELNGGAPIMLLPKPASTTVQTVNISVTDQNGCQTGLVSAVAAIYMSNLAPSCEENNNNCYQIENSNCLKSNCDNDDDAIATYTCTAEFAYYTSPTAESDNNQNEPFVWLSWLRVFDGATYVSTTSAGVELEITYAINILEKEIDFGNELYVNENTGNKNSTTTIENAGNCPIDINISGTHMAGTPSGQIIVGNIKWDLLNFNYPSDGSPLRTLGDGGELVNINAPKATTSAVIYDRMFWGIGIPYGTDTALYKGENLFTIVLDDREPWW